MKHTIKETLIAGLKARGWKEVENERSRYVAFTYQGRIGKAFVGDNGALRIGECASRSYSVQRTEWYARVLAAGKAEQAKTDKPDITQLFDRY